jgi:hypothetical protein
MRASAKRVVHTLLSLLSAATVAGCSGGGAGVSTPTLPQQTDTTQSVGRTIESATSAEPTIKFTISITPKKANPRSALPLYISQSTESMKILVDSASPVVVNLTPTSPNCSPNPKVPGSFICTASINVAPGNHVFTVTMYDKTGGTGNILSTNTTGTIVVSPTGTTTVPIVLQGVAQFVALTLATPNPPVGTSVTIPLTAVVQDADHNLIVGPAVFNNPVTLTTTDAANGVLSKTTLNSPADETGLTVKYSGANVASITFSATATGLAKANVTNAVLTPGNSGGGGSNALGIYTANGKTYAFVPNANGLAVVTISNGSALAASKTAQSLSRASVAAIQLPLTPLPSACTTDAADALLFCFSFFDPRVSVLDLSRLPSAPTVKATYTTDAASGVNNSSGGCEICGAVYDSSQRAIIYATGNGYELYSSPLATRPNTHVKTVAVNVSENFGYYPGTDTVFSPEYNGFPFGSQSIDIVPLGGNVAFSLSPKPATLEDPDGGAVDASTGIGVSTEEIAASTGSTNTAYLVNIGAPVLNSPSSGRFSAPENTTTLASSLFGFSNATQCAVPVTNIAVDTKSHLAFFSAEFCAQQNTDPNQGSNGSVTPVGVAVLPSSSTSPLQFGKSIFANLPPLPDGTLWDDALDPHAIATFNLPNVCDDCGAVFNLEDSWIAVINLSKLLAAPASATDPHTVDPTYDLIANGVVTYVPTGFTTTPAAAAARPHLRRR